MQDGKTQICLHHDGIVSPGPKERAQCQQTAARQSLALQDGSSQGQVPPRLTPAWHGRSACPLPD